MDSETYWEKRAEEQEKYWYKKSQETIEKELARYYVKSLGHIQTDIAALYGRFAKDNALSVAEARKLLTTSEYRRWRMSIEEYLKKIKETGDKGLERELNVLAMRSRISRLDKLYSETLMELDGLGRNVSKSMMKFLTDAYKDTYYHGLYDIGKEIGLKTSFASVNRDDLTRVLRNRWSGMNYSQRIWKNQRLLASTLKKEMVAAVHRGESVDKISTRIAKRMDVGISNARRLVRTELNYVENQSAMNSIRDSGMKYYRFSATLDRRTSAICREHDGNVYPIDDYQPGSTAPPLHPNCRSTISGSLYGPNKAKTGTRAARDERGKTVYVPANMTYADWMAVYVDKSKSLEEWKNPLTITIKKVDIIQSKNDKTTSKLEYIGKIDRSIYQVVTENIRSNKVILSATQKAHIQDHHPEVYEQYKQYMAEMVAVPDYIIEANRPNSALVLKSFVVDDLVFKLVLRLQTSSDPEGFENSIITFMKIDEKEWKRLLRNKKILYKRDNNY